MGASVAHSTPETNTAETTERRLASDRSIVSGRNRGLEFPLRWKLPRTLDQRPIIILVGTLAATTVFMAYANFVLNHFYRYGAAFLDTGLLADLAWHKPADLPGGAILHNLSFYAIHIAPILSLLSVSSWLVPLSMAQWFALFTGIAHALLAIGVFWLLVTEYGLRSGWRLLVATAFAMAFSFNGLAIAQVRYPHFEVLIASSLTLFLVALWRERIVLATVFLGIALICREDAGFHAVAMLAVLVAMRRFFDGAPLSAQKPALIFLTVGLVYSVGVLWLGRMLFPEQSSFVRVYLGSPPLAHISPSLLTLRLQMLVALRSYIVFPMVGAAVWAILARNPYLVVGYIAFIPWTVLQLLAKSDLAGTLSSYYGFPYLVAAFWPLIGWRIGAARAARPAWEPYVGFGAMILASFTALSVQHNPSRIPIWDGFTDPPSLTEQASLEHAIKAIHADHALLGRVVADDSIVSLRPEEFDRRETLVDYRSGKPDALIYFAGDRDCGRIAGLAARSGLSRAYAVAGSPMRVITDAKLADLPTLGVLLKPLPSAS